MRELTSHKVNGLNDALTIKVLDEPGAGNACHGFLDLGERQRVFSAGVLARLEAFEPVLDDGQQCLVTQAVESTLVMWLHSRTRERVARGVEGTSAK